ncbi:MAG: hypothetical protein AB7U41_06015 [Dongiaceae bacterium]
MFSRNDILCVLSGVIFANGALAGMWFYKRANAPSAPAITKAEVQNTVLISEGDQQFLVFMRGKLIIHRIEGGIVNGGPQSLKTREIRFDEFCQATVKNAERVLENLSESFSKTELEPLRARYERLQKIQSSSAINPQSLWVKTNSR